MTCGIEGCAILTEREVGKGLRAVYSRGEGGEKIQERGKSSETKEKILR